MTAYNKRDRLYSDYFSIVSFCVAMAKQLQFGDQATADVKVKLIHTDETAHEENTLYLHSEVLRKSDFYKEKLSEHCSEEPPIEIQMEITSPNSAEIYKKCLRLVYSSQNHNRFVFSSVDEALAILPVASEWSFHDAMDRSLQYLDAVRWNGEQEAKLRALLSTLQITPFPDLAARLGTGECEFNCAHLEMLEQTLQRRFSLISQTSNWYNQFWNKNNIRSGIEKFVVESYRANASSEIADVCRSVILKEFSDNVEIIKSAEDNDLRDVSRSILWLLDLIKRCEAEGLYEKVLRLFCEDVELLHAVQTLQHRANIGRDTLKHLLDILINRFLKCLAKGELITPTSFRNYFLTNWVPALVTNIHYLRSITRDDTFVIDDFEETMEKGIICIAETLHLPEQNQFYYIWEEAYRINSINSNRAFEWWTKRLTEGHLMSGHPADDAISKRILVMCDHTAV